MAGENRMRDPYTVLGIPRSADQTEIKAAWRTMAKKLHPDQNRSDPHAQSRFTEVGRAYDLLKDPAKKRRYDEMMSRASGGGSGPGTGAYGGNASAAPSASRPGQEPTFMEKRAEKARQEAEARARAEAEARMREEAELKARMKAQADARAKAEAEKAEADAGAPEAEEAVAENVTPEQHEQFFEKLFGSRRRGGDKAEAPHVERRGASKSDEPEAEAPKAEAPKAEAPRAEAQKADAAQPEEKVATDETVARAAYAEQDDSPADSASASPALGLFSYLVKRLTGQVAAPEKAPDLNVDAHVTIEDLLNRINPVVTLSDGKSLSITLPEDAIDGTTVRMEGYGHKLPGMKRGDLLATIRIRPHRWYRVDHYDLITHHDIDIENAVLGCDAKVETPDGPVTIRIPEWSGSGRTIKVDGKGLPRGNGRRGNLIVEIRVMLWDRPDQKVVDLMRSMREGLFL